MSNSTIGAMMGGVAVALSAEHAAPLLAMSMPEAVAGGGISIERGERFAVSGGVAVVPVRGLLTPNQYLYEKYLGWTTYHGMVETAAELADREDVREVVLMVDSPGGYVLGVEAAAEAIAELNKVKKVRALVHPLAASAAYWIASQTGEIVMTPGSQLGSIGTAAIAASIQGPGGNGVQLFDLASSHARAKRPDPATDEGAAELQRALDESEARFHAAVSQGRGIAIEELPAAISVTDDPKDGGAMYRFEDAKSRGLVDRQMSKEAFFAEVMAANAAKPSPGKSRAMLAQAALAQSQS